MNRILAINYELAEQRALMVQKGERPQKVNHPKRKRRSKAEMETAVTSAIRYLIDEEYNGATQSGAEQRFGLPAGILSKGKWAEKIDQFRKMR